MNHNACTPRAKLFRPKKHTASVPVGHEFQVECLRSSYVVLACVAGNFAWLILAMQQVVTATVF